MPDTVDQILARSVQAAGEAARFSVQEGQGVAPQTPPGMSGEALTRGLGDVDAQIPRLAWQLAMMLGDMRKYELLENESERELTSNQVGKVIIRRTNNSVTLHLSEERHPEGYAVDKLLKEFKDANAAQTPAIQEKFKQYLIGLARINIGRTEANQELLETAFLTSLWRINNRDSWGVDAPTVPALGDLRQMYGQEEIYQEYLSINSTKAQENLTTVAVAAVSLEMRKTLGSSVEPEARFDIDAFIQNLCKPKIPLTVFLSRGNPAFAMRPLRDMLPSLTADNIGEFKKRVALYFITTQVLESIGITTGLTLGQKAQKRVHEAIMTAYGSRTPEELLANKDTYITHMAGELGEGLTRANDDLQAIINAAIRKIEADTDLEVGLKAQIRISKAIITAYGSRTREELLANKAPYINAAVQMAMNAQKGITEEVCVAITREDLEFKVDKDKIRREAVAALRGHEGSRNAEGVSHLMSTRIASIMAMSDEKKIELLNPVLIQKSRRSSGIAEQEWQSLYDSLNAETRLILTGLEDTVEDQQKKSPQKVLKLLIKQMMLPEELAFVREFKDVAKIKKDSLDQLIGGKQNLSASERRELISRLGDLAPGLDETRKTIIANLVRKCNDSNLTKAYDQYILRSFIVSDYAENDFSSIEFKRILQDSTKSETIFEFFRNNLEDIDGCQKFLGNVAIALEGTQLVNELKKIAINENLALAAQISYDLELAELDQGQLSYLLGQVDHQNLAQALRNCTGREEDLIAYFNASGNEVKRVALINQDISVAAKVLYGKELADLSPDELGQLLDQVAPENLAQVLQKFTGREEDLRAYFNASGNEVKRVALINQDISVAAKVLYGKELADLSPDELGQLLDQVAPENLAQVLQKFTGREEDLRAYFNASGNEVKRVALINQDISVAAKVLYGKELADLSPDELGQLLDQVAPENLAQVLQKFTGREEDLRAYFNASGNEVKRAYLAEVLDLPRLERLQGDRNHEDPTKDLVFMHHLKKGNRAAVMSELFPRFRGSRITTDSMITVLQTLRDTELHAEVSERFFSKPLTSLENGNAIAKFIFKTYNYDGPELINALMQQHGALKKSKQPIAITNGFVAECNYNTARMQNSITAYLNKMGWADDAILKITAIFGKTIITPEMTEIKDAVADLRKTFASGTLQKRLERLERLRTPDAEQINLMPYLTEDLKKLFVKQMEEFVLKEISPTTKGRSELIRLTNEVFGSEIFDVAVPNKDETERVDKAKGKILADFRNFGVILAGLSTREQYHLLMDDDQAIIRSAHAAGKSQVVEFMLSRLTAILPTVEITPFDANKAELVQLLQEFFKTNKDVDDPDTGYVLGASETLTRYLRTPKTDVEEDFSASVLVGMMYNIFSVGTDEKFPGITDVRDKCIKVFGAKLEGIALHPKEGGFVLLHGYEECNPVDMQEDDWNALMAIIEGFKADAAHANIQGVNMDFTKKPKIRDRDLEEFMRIIDNNKDKLRTKFGPEFITELMEGVSPIRRMSTEALFNELEARVNKPLSSNKPLSPYQESLLKEFPYQESLLKEFAKRDDASAKQKQTVAALYLTQKQIAGFPGNLFDLLKEVYRVEDPNTLTITQLKPIFDRMNLEASTRLTQTEELGGLYESLNGELKTNLRRYMAVNAFDRLRDIEGEEKGTSLSYLSEVLSGVSPENLALYTRTGEAVFPHEISNEIREASKRRNIVIPAALEDLVRLRHQIRQSAEPNPRAKSSAKKGQGFLERFAAMIVGGNKPQTKKESPDLLSGGSGDLRDPLLSEQEVADAAEIEGAQGTYTPPVVPELSSGGSGDLRDPLLSEQEVADAAEIEGAQGTYTPPVVPELSSGGSGDLREPLLSEQELTEIKREVNTVMNLQHEAALKLLTKILPVSGNRQDRANIDLKGRIIAVAMHVIGTGKSTEKWPVKNHDKPTQDPIFIFHLYQGNEQAVMREIKAHYSAKSSVFGATTLADSAKLKELLAVLACSSNPGLQDKVIQAIFPLGAEDALTRFLQEYKGEIALQDNVKAALSRQMSKMCERVHLNVARGEDVYEFLKQFSRIDPIKATEAALGLHRNGGSEERKSRAMFHYTNQVLQGFRSHIADRISGIDRAKHFIDAYYSAGGRDPDILKGLGEMLTEAGKNELINEDIIKAALVIYGRDQLSELLDQVNPENLEKAVSVCTNLGVDVTEYFKNPDNEIYISAIIHKDPATAVQARLVTQEKATEMKEWIDTFIDQLTKNPERLAVEVLQLLGEEGDYYYMQYMGFIKVYFGENKDKGIELTNQDFSVAAWVSYDKYPSELNKFQVRGLLRLVRTGNLAHALRNCTGEEENLGEYFDENPDKKRELVNQDISVAARIIYGEELAGLEQEDLLELLGEVDLENLAQALRNCTGIDEDLKEYFYENEEKRVALINQDVSFAAKVLYDGKELAELDQGQLSYLLGQVDHQNLAQVLQKFTGEKRNLIEYFERNPAKKKELINQDISVAARVLYGTDIKGLTPTNINDLLDKVSDENLGNAVSSLVQNNRITRRYFRDNPTRGVILANQDVKLAAKGIYGRELADLDQDQLTELLGQVRTENLAHALRNCTGEEENLGAYFEEHDGLISAIVYKDPDVAKKFFSEGRVAEIGQNITKAMQSDKEFVDLVTAEGNFEYDEFARIYCAEVPGKKAALINSDIAVAAWVLYDQNPDGLDPDQLKGLLDQVDLENLAQALRNCSEEEKGLVNGHLARMEHAAKELAKQVVQSLFERDHMSELLQQNNALVVTEGFRKAISDELRERSPLFAGFIAQQDPRNIRRCIMAARNVFASKENHRWSTAFLEGMGHIRDQGVPTISRMTAPDKAPEAIAAYLELAIAIEGAEVVKGIYEGIGDPHKSANKKNLADAYRFLQGKTEAGVLVMRNLIEELVPDVQIEAYIRSLIIADDDKKNFVSSEDMKNAYQAGFRWPENFNFNSLLLNKIRVLSTENARSAYQAGFRWPENFCFAALSIQEIESLTNSTSFTQYSEVAQGVIHRINQLSQEARDLQVRQELSQIKAINDQKDREMRDREGKASIEAYMSGLPIDNEEIRLLVSSEGMKKAYQAGFRWPENFDFTVQLVIANLTMPPIDLAYQAGFRWPDNFDFSALQIERVQALSEPSAIMAYKNGFRWPTNTDLGSLGIEIIKGLLSEGQIARVYARSGFRWPDNFDFATLTEQQIASLTNSTSSTQYRQVAQGIIAGMPGRAADLSHEALEADIEQLRAERRGMIARATQEKQPDTEQQRKQQVHKKFVAMVRGTTPMLGALADQRKKLQAELGGNVVDAAKIPELRKKLMGNLTESAASLKDGEWKEVRETLEKSEKKQGGLPEGTLPIMQIMEDCRILAAVYSDTNTKDADKAKCKEALETMMGGIFSNPFAVKLYKDNIQEFINDYPVVFAKMNLQPYIMATLFYSQAERADVNRWHPVRLLAEHGLTPHDALLANSQPVMVAARKADGVVGHTSKPAQDFWKEHERSKAEKAQKAAQKAEESSRGR